MVIQAPHFNRAIAFGVIRVPKTITNIFCVLCCYSFRAFSQRVPIFERPPVSVAIATSFTARRRFLRFVFQLLNERFNSTVDFRIRNLTRKICIDVSFCQLARRQFQNIISRVWVSAEREQSAIRLQSVFGAQKLRWFLEHRFDILCALRVTFPCRFV